MPARHISLFLVGIALVWGAWPSLTNASVLPFAIPTARFVGLPFIPNTGTVAYQTAIRSGDDAILQVGVHSIYIDMPSVSVDFSELGGPNPAAPVGPGNPDFN